MPSRLPTKMPLAGITSVTVAAAALLVAHDSPYLETRPAQKQNITYDSRALLEVDARLWQDPFSAVDDFELRENRHFALDADSQWSATQLQRGMAPSVSSSSVPPSAGKSFEQDRYGAPIGDLRREIDGLSKLPSGESSPNGVAALTVLAITMGGGPSVGGEEARRRERYAVVSALGATQYAPEDDEHMGYVVLHPDDVRAKRVADDSASGSAASQGGYRLPFEIFTQTGNSAHYSRHVLVLWIDDIALPKLGDRSGSWLTQVSALVASLAPCV
jgi:hypothetical protein